VCAREVRDAQRTHQSARVPRLTVHRVCKPLPHTIAACSVSITAPPSPSCHGRLPGLLRTTSLETPSVRRASKRFKPGGGSGACCRLPRARARWAAEPCVFSRGCVLGDRMRRLAHAVGCWQTTRRTRAVSAGSCTAGTRRLLRPAPPRPTARPTPSHRPLHMPSASRTCQSPRRPCVARPDAPGRSILRRALQH